jgi:uncharacterized membrane protein
MLRDTFKSYGVTLFIFLVLDGLWLGLVAQPFYQAQLGYLLGARTNWAAAAAFYLPYVAGLVYFVVAPGGRPAGPRGVGPSSAW